MTFCSVNPCNLLCYCWTEWAICTFQSGEVRISCASLLSNRAAWWLCIHHGFPLVVNWLISQWSISNNNSNVKEFRRCYPFFVYSQISRCSEIMAEQTVLVYATPTSCTGFQCILLHENCLYMHYEDKRTVKWNFIETHHPSISISQTTEKVKPQDRLALKQILYVTLVNQLYTFFFDSGEKFNEQTVVI